MALERHSSLRLAFQEARSHSIRVSLCGFCGDWHPSFHSSDFFILLVLIPLTSLRPIAMDIFSLRKGTFGIYSLHTSATEGETSKKTFFQSCDSLHMAVFLVFLPGLKQIPPSVDPSIGLYKKVGMDGMDELQSLLSYNEVGIKA